MDRHILTALGFVLLLASCDELKEADLQPGNPISFSASVGEYSTKATDTAFEKGDMVGLFATSPLNLDNVPLTAGEGASLSPKTALYWDYGQTQATSFRAYYPYDENLKQSGGELFFSVKADQSTKEGYGASDFMFASTSASPADGSVGLVFGHKLSRLCISIDNQSGSVIEDVSIEGVMTEVVIDAESGRPLNSDYADQIVPVKPFVVRDGSDVTLTCVLPPQRSELLLVVTTKDGSIRCFLTSADLSSGMQHRGEITLDSNQGPEMEFSLSVKDWEYGETLNFYDGQQAPRTGWTINYYKWYADEGQFKEESIPMAQKSRGVYSACIKDYRREDEFFLLSDYDLYIYGCRLVYPQAIGVNNDEWPVVNGGRFRLGDYDGDLYVTYMPDEGILRYEYPQWEHIGRGEYVTGISSALQELKNDGNYEVPRIDQVDIFEDMRQRGIYMVQHVEHGNNIVVDASDTSRVYLKYCRGFNRGFLESPVDENRISTYGSRAYGKVRDGVITLPGLQITEADSTYVFDTPDWQFVLPGHKRNPVLGFKLNYLGTDVEWSSEVGWYISGAAFSLSLYPDMENLRYVLFSGLPTREELNMDILPDLKAGRNCETITEISPGSSNERFFVPVSKSGNYTAFFYSDAPSSGDFWRYYYQNFNISVNDSELPAADLNLSGAAPHSIFPDKVANVHLDFPNADWLSVRVIEKEAAEAGGLKEEDYYSFASAGTMLKSYALSYLSGKSGMDLAIDGLEPETEYLVVAAGRDVFDQADWAATTVKTGSAPTQWEEVGTGEWIDASFYVDASAVVDGAYRSPVAIKKAVGTERYRAVRPYAAYWEAYEGSSTGRFGYVGYDTDFDFTFVEDEGASYIYYAPYRPGFTESHFVSEGSDTGCLEFSHHNINLTKPSIYNYTRYNREIETGVYRIAPYVSIVGTPYYYNQMASDMFRLVMPDAYNVETKAMSAPAVSLEPKRGDAVYVGAETELKAFKRKPVRFGDAIVSNNNDLK